MTRHVIHIDLDAFYCAVEELFDPSLHGKAFAVGGSPDGRGVVSSCSYAARLFGIHSAMPMAQAVRLCPDLIIVRSHFDQYRKLSRAVMEYLENLTPYVERISIDEAFLDITLLGDNPRRIATELQKQINQDLGLPCSLGVSTNKLVAKIANNIGKASIRTGHYPNQIKIIPPGHEAAFLAPLPAKELWGVGKKTEQKLAKLNLMTIGDIANCSEAFLVKHFGKHGKGLARHAKGVDNRPVEGGHEAKSISKETTFGHDINDRQKLIKTLRWLADGVGRQTRRAKLRGTTIRLKLRWSDFTTLTRQSTLPYAVDQDDIIYETALALFDQTWTGRKVRLIGVGISGFTEEQRQISLWENRETSEKKETLQTTLDSLRDRYGSQSIQRGSSFGTNKRSNLDDT